jgi:hypothetical protein
MIVKQDLLLCALDMLSQGVAKWGQAQERLQSTCSRRTSRAPYVRSLMQRALVTMRLQIVLVGSMSGGVVNVPQPQTPVRALSHSISVKSCRAE